MTLLTKEMVEQRLVAMNRLLDEGEKLLAFQLWSVTLALALHERHVLRIQEKWRKRRNRIAKMDQKVHTDIHVRSFAQELDREL